MQIYTVRSGDTINAISRRFGVSSRIIINDNQLEYPDRLVVGQALMLATDMIDYVVVSGDTLYSLSQRFGVTVEAILQANPEITDRNYISPGQTIVIPMPRPTRIVEASGYCYPHIVKDTLLSSLPYLTNVLPFSYEVTFTGGLTTLQDVAIIEQAKDAQVSPLMVITNIGPTGNFDSELAGTILRSNELQDTVITNAINTIQSKGYAGLDVDFEYVLLRDRDLYSAFLAKAAGRLHALGYRLSVAIPAKTRDDQPGTLYEGVDFRAIGSVVDAALIMTYDWGYKYGPPMAIAPLNLVRGALEYAVSRIPQEKVVMGIPNYGYDWALPHVEGQGATLIMNNAALSLAVTTGSQIMFDETSKAPFFNYTDSNNRRRVVWFEDARSIKAKVELVGEYNLRGYGIWNLNNLFYPNLLVPASLYSIR